MNNLFHRGLRGGVVSCWPSAARVLLLPIFFLAVNGRAQEPAFVMTDQSDYAPGSTAYITGGGFQPGETVVLQVLHADGTPDTGEDHSPWTAVVDGSGAFQTTWHVCEDDCLGSTLLLSAAGQTSGLTAQSYFTDACPSGGGEVDLTFDPGSAVNDAVQAVAVQSDGKVLIGGLFTIVNSVLRGGIARLNADGSTDLSFLNGLPGSNGDVYSVVVQPDGKVLIGGAFNMVNGVARGNIARLNSDGSLDTTFMNGLAGASGVVSLPVLSIALQPDGKVIIGGQFGAVNGVTRTRIARLNADGSLDTTFQNGLAGANSTVRSVAVQSDGKVLIGGDFTLVNGVTRTRIARLNSDGSLDTFDATLNQSVYSVVVQPDGQVLIGGAFNTINGTSRNRIARLNSDGTLDTTFLNGPSGAINQIHSVTLQTDGKVLIGGTFTTVNGVGRTRIARLNSDGSLDTSFQNGMSGVDGVGTLSLFVASFALQTDGRVLIGGQFTVVNGVGRFRIARLNSDGSLDTGFENGPPGPHGTGSGSRIRTMALQSDGKLLMGGNFSTVNGVVRTNFARLNTDGSLDTSFLNGLAGPNSVVEAVAVQPDGKVLIGGFFTQVNGSVQNRIARLNPDGTRDTTFQNGFAGAGLQILSVALQSDGKVLVGGSFTSPFSRIARLNSDGTIDTTFLNGLSGASSVVYAVTVQPDGQLLIAGDFTSVNGTPRNRVARLNPDGSVDTTFLNGLAGANLAVLSLAIQPDGKIVIGGTFLSVNGVTRDRIARLNSDGSLDTSFLNGTLGANTFVYDVQLQPDGKVVIGGQFTLFNGVTRFGVARLNSDGSLDTTFQNGLSGVRQAGSGLVGRVESVALQSDGKVLIGGEFELVNGVVRESLARLIGSGADITPPTITCPANQVASTAPGQCSAALSYPAPVVSEECSTATVSCAPASGATFPKGTTTVNCTATDASGNTASCSFSVTVNDTEPPAASCPAPVVVSTDPGACDAVVSYTATAGDNCPGAGISCAPASGATFPKGTTTVNCTATDASGNTASCSFTVTVNDTEPPAASCPAPVIVSTDPGACDAVVSYTATASDNCPGAGISCVPAGGATFPKGTTTVNCTATDASGNTASCSFTVTVNDTEPPAASCPAPAVVSTDPSACDAVVTYTATASDNCPGAGISCAPASGATFPKGITTVSCTATDASGNTASCSFTVTVNDTEPPAASCPAPVIVSTDPGACDAVVSYTATASDNCPGAGISCVPAGGATFPKGTTTVNCTAADASGNTASCSFTVTVNDTEPPAASCPAPVIVSTDPGACDAAVSYAATASDNCPGAGISCVPASGATFPKGVTTVNCTATDASGNTANCSFTVTVNDTEPPAASCPAPVIVSTDPGACDAAVSYTATASDNCPGAGISCVPVSGATFPKGTTTVNCTATDASGNTASCSFSVTVNDTEPPAASCPAPVVVSTDPGACDAVVSYTATASDNCPGAGISCVPASGATFPKGTTTVNCTATDASGNTASCSFSVTVNDTEPPAASCPAPVVVSTDPGACDAVVSYTATASDNCPGAGISCVPASGATFSKGTTTVSCTATDASGNTASCSFSVTVNDTEAPTILCPPPVVTPCTDNALEPVDYPVLVGSDNCDGASAVCVPPSGSSFPLGTTIVTCTAIDTSDNIASCSFSVTRGAFTFTGFLPPIDGADATGGSFSSPLRTFKLKSTIPVKFHLSCGSTPVSVGIHILQAIKYSSASSSETPIDATPTGAATTGNQFRLTSAATGEWHFNLDTKAGFSVGTWKLVATLSDGSQHEVWITLKK